MRIFLARLPDGSHASRKTAHTYTHAVVWQVTQADVDLVEAAYTAALACTDADRAEYARLERSYEAAAFTPWAATIGRKMARHPAALLAVNGDGVHRGKSIIDGLRAKIGRCGLAGFCGSLALAEKLRATQHADPYLDLRTYTIVETIPT
jgi:hypothetical protein